MFTNGFSDQFNEEGVKYKRVNLKNLLDEIRTLPTIKQQEILESRFNKWKGKTEQTDDTLILGIKI